MTNPSNVRVLECIPWPINISSFFQYVMNLILLSAFVAVGSRRVNINGQFSHFAEKMNAKQRNSSTTKRPLPEISLGSRVKYHDAIFLGVDSLKRKGECWQEVKGNVTNYEINYGFHFMTIVLPSLEIDGKNMSGFVRIRDNAVHLSYDLHEGSDKCLSLNELQIVKIGDVEFGASRPEYDGTNLEGHFKLVVKPTLNKFLEANIKNIEDTLQPLCKDFNKEDSFEELVMTLL